MAYRGPSLCVWIRFILRHAEKERVGKGRSVGGRSEATGEELIWRLSSGDSGCAGKAWDIASCRCGKCTSGATTFLLPFAPLCSILLAFLVEQSSLFSPSPSFSSSSSSPSGTVLSCEQAQIDFSLCPGGNLPSLQFFAPSPLPLTKPPLATPTHRLAGLRNG